MLSYFEYDEEGNRTRESYTTADAPANRIYYQLADIKYDELNRVVDYVDPQAHIQYQYDANGNLRRVLSSYNDAISGAPATQDFWYKYDSQNRFVLTMGQLSNGVIGLGANGVQIGYDVAGQRRSASYADGHSEAYDYTSDGYLEDVRINGVLRSRRANDLLGRVQNYSEYADNGSTVIYNKTSQFDADNRLLQDTVVNSPVGGAATTTITKYDYRLKDGNGNYTGADQGVVTHSFQYDPSKAAGTGVHTDTSFVWWDEAKQSQITLRGTDPANPNAVYWKPGLSDFTYDVNGHVKQVHSFNEGTMSNTLQNAKTLTYTSDQYGQVLRRDMMIGATLGLTQRYYYLNGQLIGDISNNGPSNISYAEQLAQRGNPSGNFFRYGKPVASADFDQNYQPINADYPGASASSYTAKDGDTLSSIARAVWGDSTLWYLIADANGLTNGDHIAAGQVISIPNKVSNFHNTASTFRVYNPGQAIGDTLPYLPTEPLPPPPPSSDGGCGSFVQFLAMVVAIVVTIYTAGAVPPAWGPVAAGAIGGAAGATASQAVLIAGGQQNGFDWTGVAMGAIGGAVAGGVVQYGPALQGSSAFTQGVVRGAITSVVSQGVEVATGLQSHFDWRSVAASAIATGVSAGVADSIGRSQFGDKGWEAVRSGASMSDAGQTMTRGIAAGLAAGAASSLVRGGSFQNNLPGILRDVVASTIGNAVVDQMAATPTKIYGYDDGNTPVGEKFQLADRSGSANGMTEGQYWNGPARTVADQYADVYGGSVVNATGRPVRTSDGLTVSDGGERGNTKFTRLNGIDKGADSLTPKRTHDVSYMITDPAEFLDARNTQTSTWNDYVDSTAANPYGDKANDQALRIAYNRQWTDGVMVGSAQGSGLLPAQEFVNRNGMLYDSPLGGAVYGGLRTVGVNDNTARAFGALGNSVEMAGAVATGAPFAKPRTVNVVGVNNAAVVGDAVPTLGPGWSVTAPRGLGSATGPLPPGYTTVSRWVSPDEAATWMQNGGTAIPTGIGAGNRVYVTALDAAKPGGTGPIRIDFAVPEKALSTAGKPEWFQMFQPMPSTPVYNVQIHVPPGTVIPKVK